MKVTVQELAIINGLIQVDDEGKSRTFSIWELNVWMEIFNELKKNVKDDKFEDWDVTLKTEHKSLLLRMIQTRKFWVLEAEYVFTLKKKLEE